MSSSPSSEPKRRRWPRRVAVALGVLVLAYVVLLLGFQRELLFPRRWVQATGMPVEAGMREVSLESGAEAWFAAAEGATPQAPGPLVIYAHGNGEVIDRCGGRMNWYRERGISVLLVEYRGYGRSPGSPSQARIVSDFVEAYDLAITFPEVDERRVAFHGLSLGGGVVCSLAGERSPAALILQSTFTSIPDVAPWWAASVLALDRFDNLECVADYEGPVLIVHGRNDTLVPVEQAERMHAASSSSELVLYGGGHNDAPPEGWRAIAGFVNANL